MTEPTGIRDHVRVLNGVARCAHCAAALLKVGPNYACPTVIANRPGACPTDPIDGKDLLHLVVERIVSRTINDQTIEQIVVEIKNEYGEKALTIRESLDLTEEAISELNELKSNIVYRVEEGTEPFEEVNGQINEIDEKALGLAFEARLSRRKIEEYDFVADEDRIRTDAQDLSTYLSSATPDETKELLDMFVRSVDVDSDSVVVHYTDKVPGVAASGVLPSDRVRLHRTA